MDKNSNNHLGLHNNFLDHDKLHESRNYSMRHNDGHRNDNWNYTDRDFVTRRSRSSGRKFNAWLPLLFLPLILFGAVAYNTLQNASENNDALQQPQPEVGVGGGPDNLTPTISPTPAQRTTPTPSVRNNDTVIPGIGGSAGDTTSIPDESPDVGYGTI